MRRFRFKLDALLKHRALMETLRLQAFASVQRELSACEARIAAARAEYARILSAPSTPLDLFYLERREHYLDGLNARIAQEERVREGIAARLEDARAALIRARQAREAVERVRRRAYEEYVEEITHEEQAILDEMAILRHRR